MGVKERFNKVTKNPNLDFFFDFFVCRGVGGGK